MNPRRTTPEDFVDTLGWTEELHAPIDFNNARRERRSLEILWTDILGWKERASVSR